MELCIKYHEPKGAPMELCDMYYKRESKPIDITGYINGFTISRPSSPIFSLGSTEPSYFARERSTMIINFKGSSECFMGMIQKILTECKKEVQRPIVFEAGLGASPRKIIINDYMCDYIGDEMLIFSKMKMAQIEI